MDTKLTLRLEKNIIEQIKIYAMRRELSVSDLTENLYKNVLNSELNASGNQLPLIAKKYKGIIRKHDLDFESTKLDYLKEKHIK